MSDLAAELTAIRADVLHMGRLALQMFDDAAGVLNSGDTAVVKEIFSNELKLDQMQLKIDREAIRLITQYAPIESDLRFLLSTTRITAELERIGDQAVNMCEFLELVLSDNTHSIMSMLEKMSGMVSDMLRDTMDSYEIGDSSRAIVIIRSDNRIDAMNDHILQVMLGEADQDKSISTATVLAIILIARSLERIADQATNICEDVVYMTRGDDIRHSSDSLTP